MELKQLIEKWTKEMAGIKSHIKKHEDTFGHPAVTSRERLEAISDILADVKQLNILHVSNPIKIALLEQLEDLSEHIPCEIYTKKVIEIKSNFNDN